MVLTRQCYKELGILPLCDKDIPPNKKQTKIPSFFQLEKKGCGNLENPLPHPHEWSVDHLWDRREDKIDDRGAAIDLATELQQAELANKGYEDQAACSDQDPAQEQGLPLGSSENESNTAIIPPPSGENLRGFHSSDSEERQGSTGLQFMDNLRYIIVGMFEDLLSNYSAQISKDLESVKDFLSESLGLLSTLVELKNKHTATHILKPS